jgi:hypothetical protein
MARSPSLLLLAALAAFLPAARAGDHKDAPAAESRYFQPPRRPAVPAVRDRAWVANPIDAFVLARLEAAGLAPGDRADRLTLLRRVTFDLTGLPPTPAEQGAFLADDRPGAYERVVERLLASPHYGERWAQHWLDLVRYAESDGFKADDLRPDAHRYRDWVIRALNADLPYDRFVRQQLAGDELEPDSPDALVATGYLRLWPDEYNAANLEQRRQEILNDVTDVTGSVFLGLTFECARCHDHKYDPIAQADYYRLQSFFSAIRTRDLPAADAATRRDHQRRVAAWEAATREIRAEIDALLESKRRSAREYALTKFRPEIQEAVKTPPERRTPYQWQIALMAEKQMDQAAEGAPAKLKGEEKKRYQELQKRLAALPAPAPLPRAMAVTDVGPEAPPTHRLLGGDWRKPREKLRPGFPSFLPAATPDAALPPGVRSTGLRSALARWLTRPDHPLTARVLVNRLWQHHFGHGIVGTASDFGSQGEAATHPELLDWLATEFVRAGWSMKHLHRLMVTSATYCQTSRVNPDDPRQARALEADRGNRLLWHARRHRLGGEALRDAMLALTGELSPRLFGVSARPELPAGVSKYAWKADARPEDRNRRSVYVLVRRNMRFPLFDAFDLPDLHNSCSRRLATTTAPQALQLLNGDFTLERARAFAAVLKQGGGDDAARIDRACRLAWGRPATSDELRLAQRFLDTQAEALRKTVLPGTERDAALADFCHALLNANEFLYVD